MALGVARAVSPPASLAHRRVSAPASSPSRVVPSRPPPASPPRRTRAARLRALGVARPAAENRGDARRRGARPRASRPHLRGDDAEDAEDAADADDADADDDAPAPSARPTHLSRSTPTPPPPARPARPEPPFFPSPSSPLVRRVRLAASAEDAFVRVALLVSGAFVLAAACASLALSGLLFAMGVKETAYEAFAAWTNFSPVELVTAAVGALDRFLFGMVCLVFGLGSFELFLARSNREGEVRDERLRTLSWLTVTSVDDLEQKVGEIIVAVMVVNLVRERRRERRVRAASARRRALSSSFSRAFEGRRARCFPSRRDVGFPLFSVRLTQLCRPPPRSRPAAQLEMSLHMKYSKALDLVWASLAALASAAALALLHWSAGSRHGR